MNKADAFIRKFFRENREIRLRQKRVDELRRVVLECEQAMQAGDRKRARALFAKADKIRAQLDK